MKKTLSHAENVVGSDPLESLRKRALFRSNHRGCKEMDLVMGQFAEQKLAALEKSQLELYNELLNEDDMLIWDWVVGRIPADQKYMELVEMLQGYAPEQ